MGLQIVRIYDRWLDHAFSLVWHRDALDFLGGSDFLFRCTSFSEENVACSCEAQISAIATVNFIKKHAVFSALVGSFIRRYLLPVSDVARIFILGRQRWGET